MGNILNQSPQQTSAEIILERELQQAGSIMRGELKVCIGDNDAFTLQNYNLVIVEIQLTGTELVWWTRNSFHHPNQKTNQRLVRAGPDRREASKQLIQT